jgi:hypothetical protein
MYLSNVEPVIEKLMVILPNDYSKINIMTNPLVWTMRHQLPVPVF